MDLGVLLESPQGSQSSSRVGACTCAFLLSCGSSVTLPIAWIKGSVAFPRGFPSRLSHEAFLRGFTTGLSHVPLWFESIFGVKVEAVWGKQVPLKWTETSGGLLEWWPDLEYLSPFLWRGPPLEMRREPREFFFDQVGKGSLISSKEAETGLLWMWAGPFCFLSSAYGYIGELLELQQGCEGTFGRFRG